jgi:hypothetical protein
VGTGTWQCGSCGQQAEAHHARFLVDFWWISWDLTKKHGDFLVI